MVAIEQKFPHGTDAIAQGGVKHNSQPAAGESAQENGVSGADGKTQGSPAGDSFSRRHEFWQFYREICLPEKPILGNRKIMHPRPHGGSEDGQVVVFELDFQPVVSPFREMEACGRMCSPFHPENPDSHHEIP
jgi:hypothetical protein